MNSAPETIADVERSAGQDDQRVHDLHARCGPCARRLRAQTNIVRQDGVRGALMSIYKIGNGSTLTIVKRVKGIVPIASSVAAAGSHGQAAVRSVVVRARIASTECCAKA